MDEKPGQVYPDAGAWLADWLAPRYRRSWTNGRVWCSEWHQHPEAVSRIDGLWMAWEKFGPWTSGTDLATWWRDYADPTMDALTAEHGPFAKCVNGHTDRLAPLPLTGLGAPEEVRGV